MFSVVRQKNGPRAVAFYTKKTAIAGGLLSLPFYDCFSISFSSTTTFDFRNLR